MTTSHSLATLLSASAGGMQIRQHLDGLAPYERSTQVLALRGKQVAKLYATALDNPPLTLADIVSESDPGMVIYDGRNSLPAFSRFQKRFTRVDDTIVGFNYQMLTPLTGPGFFVVRSASAAEAVPNELYFDYTSAPPIVPPGFPLYRSNEVGFSRLVYMDMKDFCRTVARGVLVGHAYRRDKPQNAYFVLTRAG